MSERIQTGVLAVQAVLADIAMLLVGFAFDQLLKPANRAPQGPQLPSPSAINSRLDVLVNTWGATFVRMVLHKSDDPSADATTSDISLGSQHLQVRFIMMLAVSVSWHSHPTRLCPRSSRACHSPVDAQTHRSQGRLRSCSAMVITAMQDTKDIVDHVATYTNPDGSPRVYIMLTVYFNDPTVNNQTNLPTCETVAVWQALAQVRLHSGSDGIHVRDCGPQVALSRPCHCRVQPVQACPACAWNPQQPWRARTDVRQQPARHLQHRQRADPAGQLPRERRRVVGQRLERDEHLRLRHPPGGGRRWQPWTAPDSGAGVLLVLFAMSSLSSREAESYLLATLSASSCGCRGTHQWLDHRVS